MNIVRQSADMSHQLDRPSRTSAPRGAVSRDAGLLRIRALTKGTAVTAAVGSVALGLLFAHPGQSQAASTPTATTPGQSSSDAQAAPAPSDQQQQLAPPAQPPADVAPQSPPQAVSGGS